MMVSIKGIYYFRVPFSGSMLNLHYSRVHGACGIAVQSRCIFLMDERVAPPVEVGETTPTTSP